jgi:hypothetical protein
MTNWKAVRIGCAAGTLALMVAGSVMAMTGHENQMTFSRAVALPGVVLPAGSYTFDTADSNALDVVVVRSKADNRVLYMGFTTQVRRPRGMSPNTAVTLGEASGNEALPITAWYEIGQSIGHQFRY